MEKELRKPTFLQILIGWIFTNLKINYKYLSYKAPPRIGKYKLFYEIEKDYKHEGFATGIYQQGTKRVFIKTWYGVVTDLRYNTLLVEYFSNKILYKKFSYDRLYNTKYIIRVPKIIGYKLQRHSFSLIFEFVEGKNLSLASLKKQAEAIYSVLLTFRKISRFFTQQEKEYFRHLSKIYYLSSLPFFTFLTLFSNPTKYKVILKAFIDSLKLIKSINFEKLTLTHRDLEPQNIILNNSVLYLIDFERAVFTIPNYDVNYLSLIPNHKNLAKVLFKILDLKPNEFLKNYILIQFSYIPDKPNFTNYFMQELQAKYA